MKSNYTIKTVDSEHIIIVGNTAKFHGLTKHPIYYIYNDILQRCYNPNHRAYKWYGARGITMSDEFRYDIEAFFKYVESLSNYKNRKVFKLTLDRINNNGNYECGNLRWATMKVQVANSRKRTKTFN